MKNICIVSFCNLYYLPYARTYIDIFKSKGAKCTLLFWDRDAANGEHDDYNDCEKIVFQTTPIRQPSKVKLIVDYCKATSFINKYLKLYSKQFTGVVFLQSHCAVACYSTLIKYYCRRFVLDIRDYSLEYLWPFYYIEKKLLENSFANVISSPAYKEFLPKSDYFIAHNYTPFSNEHIDRVTEVFNSSPQEPIRISYVGTVRFYEMDKKILKIFANDDRFQINYYGRGSEVLVDFCEQNNIRNVDFHGSFSPNDLVDFYEKTDLINNLYGNHTKELDYALSNKLYHAGQFLKPILVCPDTYMATIVTQYNMGFVLDYRNKTVADDLFNWYKSINQKEFHEGCYSFISKVIEDNKQFEEMCNLFVSKIN